MVARPDARAVRLSARCASQAFSSTCRPIGGALTITFFAPHVEQTPRRALERTTFSFGCSNTVTSEDDRDLDREPHDAGDDERERDHDRFSSVFAGTHAVTNSSPFESLNVVSS